MVDFKKPDFVHAGQHRYAVYKAIPDAVDAQKPALFLMHGFPELAYSWRYQMKAFAEAGYCVYAPDMLGYGQTDKPKDKQSYRTQAMAQDMAHILDHYDLCQAVFVGDDWGALLLWTLPFVIPKRVLGYIGLNVGYVHDYPADPIQLMEAKFGADMYMVQFQRDDINQYLEADITNVLNYFFRTSSGENNSSKKVRHFEKSLALLSAMKCSPDEWGGKPLLNQADFEVYRQAFEQGGFQGPLNWYRNLTQNWMDKRNILQKHSNNIAIKQPCLMITADHDHACPPYLADGMPQYFENYSRHDLTNCGHWSMKEKTQEVNQVMIEWLQVFDSV